METKIIKKKAMLIFAPITFSFIVSLFLYLSGGILQLENGIHEYESSLTQKQYESDLTIVEVDHASIKALTNWPWPRRYYATVLDNLIKANAEYIFFDIDFSAESNPMDDTVLSESLQKAKPGSVFMPSFLQYLNTSNTKYLSLNKPNTKFIPYVTPVSVNLNPDDDGLVRRIKILTEFAGEIIPAAATLLTQYPAEIDEYIKLNLRISPSSFQRISFYDIYTNNFDPTEIAGKKIIIGATALELSDQIAIPVHTSLAGPVVQALSYQTLVIGKLTTVSKAFTLLLLLAMIYPIARILAHSRWRNGLWKILFINLSILIVSITLHTKFNILLDVIPLILFTTLSYLLLQFASIDKQFYQILKQKIKIDDQEAMMTHVIKNTSEGIILLDKSLLVTSANAAAGIIFNCNEDELVGNLITNLLADIDVNSTLNQLETYARKKDGSILDVQITLNKIKTNNDEIYTIFIHDISERKKQQAILTYELQHDSLTGLNNRAYMLTKIKAAIINHEKTKQPITLILIDLNNFKSINDTLGHSTGDTLLIAIAERLKKLNNKTTCVVRLGGDEFSLLTSDISSAEQLKSYIENIQYNISQPIDVSDMSLSIDAAIGVAQYPEHATSINELMMAADVAMYKSKQSQKIYSVYDPETDYHTKRNLTISNDIKQALLRHELILQYQPKVDLKTNKVVSMEALIRWNHPTLGLIRPDEFIPVVENSALIKPVTMYTVEAAITKQLELKNAGINISIAVNISTKLLDDMHLSDDIIQLIDSYGSSADAIVLEITESAAMSSEEQALIVLNQLIDKNFKLSIDDFGTGNASYAYLKQLPASELKIDRMFITDLCTDKSDQIITSSVISLAHGLNMKVVAEGIEDEQTYAFLQELGCDIAQGYWVSKPLPSDEVIKWTTQWNSNAPIKYKVTNALSNASQFKEI